VTLECSAAGSSDEDGNLVGWDWNVESAPVGADVPFDPTRAEVTTLFVEALGFYVLSANVTDDSGQLNAIFCDSDADRVPDRRGCEEERVRDPSITCGDGEGGFDASDCQARRRDRVVVEVR
jgi:hypothetical protein